MTDRQARFERLTRIVEWPMAFMALALIPALIIEDQATDPTLRQMALMVNWAVWLAFCAEYGLKLTLAPSRVTFVRAAWFDLLIILLSPPFLVPDAFEGARSLRVLRVLRLARVLAVVALTWKLLGRVLKRHRFHQLGVVAIVLVGLCAVCVYYLERGANPSITTFGDALWWAVVTATTVGYGDVSPVTSEGRVLAVLLMMAGIGVIGAFTATVASFFLEEDEASESAKFQQQLNVIENKLDHLLEEVRSGKR